jgi:hypothetical protein
VTKQQSGFDASAFDPRNIAVAILTNIASSVLEHHIQRLEGTWLRQALRVAGLVEFTNSTGIYSEPITDLAHDL